MRRAAVILGVLVMQGCAAVPGPAVEVLVPVATECRVSVPPAPDWATNVLPYNAPLDLWVAAVLAERRQRIAYLSEVSAVLSACGVKWQTH